MLGTNTIETDSSKVKNTNRKRKNEEDGSDDGGKTGVGIYRKNTTKMEFNYGAEYKAKVNMTSDPYISLVYILVVFFREHVVI